MKVLIVASYNESFYAPFIVEQAQALQQSGVEVDYFGVVGKGIKGYLKALFSLQKKIKEFQPDVIHAHYGLSGLLANLQRKVPVVTTYHGSDINAPSILCFSKWAMRLSKWNIFVSQRNLDIAQPKKKFSLLPCGVDMENFTPRSKQEARKALGWDMKQRYVLFAGAFDKIVKNAPLAQQTVALLKGVELIEMKGYKREQVANLFYASDALLLTSFSEGSPQVVKEAMACNCPVVSVDVGDVAERLYKVENSYVTTSNSHELAKYLNKIFETNQRTNGRNLLLQQHLDNSVITQKLIAIYSKVI